MHCRKCKGEIPDASAFCNHCGAKQESKKGRRMRSNGMGTAYKRGKTWTASVIIGWKDKDGEPVPVKRTKGGFGTKKAALEHCQALRGEKRLASKLTFAQVYQLWHDIHETKVSKSTMDCYRAAYKYYEDIHYMRFADVGLDDLQDCMDGCPRGKRTKENMKALGTLLYKYALPRHIAEMDYAQYLDCGNDAKGTREALTDEHVELIRQAIGKVPYAEHAYCLIYTGFRPNEMLSMTRDAYNAKSNTLTGGFKTEAGTNRIVTLSPKIKGLVQALVIKASPYIFPRQDGSLMQDDYFRTECFYPLLDALGIQPIPPEGERARYTPYSCRHSFANLMKNVPGSDTDKAALMGHTSAEMTKYYQSADLDSLRAITDKI